MPGGSNSESLCGMLLGSGRSNEGLNRCPRSPSDLFTFLPIRDGKLLISLHNIKDPIITLWFSAAKVNQYATLSRQCLCFPERICNQAAARRKTQTFSKQDRTSLPRHYFTCKLQGFILNQFNYSKWLISPWTVAIIPYLLSVAHCC